jgi:rhamnose utilization protein RhaD (predicted bifunctional aldolase and dehydrogenase)
MDRKNLALILKKTYPESSAEREKEVLADMMAAKKTGEEQKRPSVEALLHDIIPFPFVVHLHPALVNGLTCSVHGEKAVREIFGEDVLWIPSINPGYILSIAVKSALEDFYKKLNKQASIIFLQNHGVFVGSDSADGIKDLYSEIISKIGVKIKRTPDFSDQEIITSLPPSAPLRLCEIKLEIFKILKELGGEAAFMTGSEVNAFIKDRKSFYPVSSAFTPDHIVYAGSDPLFSEEQSAEGIRQDWKSHALKTGRNPKIVAVKDLGVFGTAKTEKAASLALDLFRDSLKVAVYCENFGGPLFLTADKIDFINNWEVERFRSDVSTK